MKFNDTQINTVKKLLMSRYGSDSGGVVEALEIEVERLRECVAVLMLALANGDCDAVRHTLEHGDPLP